MKNTLIALALAAALPLSANAAERGYSYVEGFYTDAGNSIDGFGARGSVQFADTSFYALGDFRNYSGRGGNADLWELGLGYALNLSDNLDLIAEGAYVDLESLDGYRLSTGLRGNFTPNIEGVLKANYRNIDGAEDGDFTGTAGLQYRFSPTWGVTGEVEFGQGDQIYLVGVRASF